MTRMILIFNPKERS